ATGDSNADQIPGQAGAREGADREDVQREPSDGLQPPRADRALSEAESGTAVEAGCVQGPHSFASRALRLTGDGAVCGAGGAGLRGRADDPALVHAAAEARVRAAPDGAVRDAAGAAGADRRGRVR